MYPSMHWVGGVSARVVSALGVAAQGGCVCPGRLCLPREGVSAQGGGVCPGGSTQGGGVCLGGLPREGVSAGGCLPRGCLPEGVCVGGVSPRTRGRQSPVDRQTPVKA